MVLHYILTIISAIALFISFKGHAYAWITFIALIPFLHTLNNIQNLSSAKKTLRCYAQQGLIFGLCYMGLTNLWVFQLIEFSTPLQITILFIVYTSLEALYFGLISSLFSIYNKKLWLLPFIWILLEYIRSSGEFGSANGLIGYSQATNTQVNHLAQLGGIHFLSFICISINILIYQTLKALKNKKYQLSIIFISILIIISSSHLFYSLPQSTKKELPLSIIQVNHPITYKLNRKNRKQVRTDYIQLTKKALKEFPAQLVIWPETISASQNLYFKNFMSNLTDLTNQYNTSILFGTPRKQQNNYYNSAILLNQEKSVIYNKNLLMPFGEYWPFKSIFKAFGLKNIIPGSEFSRGNNLPIAKVNGITIATAICLETTTPSIYKKYLNNDIDILISLVNNGWFKTSNIAARQLQILQIRALETGRPILQSANMGYTTAIDPNGKIIKILPQFKQDNLNINLSLTKINTPYIIVGDIIIYISFALLLLKLLPYKKLKS